MTERDPFHGNPSGLARIVNGYPQQVVLEAHRHTTELIILRMEWRRNSQYVELDPHEALHLANLLYSWADPKLPPPEADEEEAA